LTDLYLIFYYILNNYDEHKYNNATEITREILLLCYYAHDLNNRKMALGNGGLA